MSKYSLIIDRNVYRALRFIPTQDYNRILQSIEQLSENPRPAGSKKLKGRSGYRIRVGNYRIIYEINDGALIVQVIEAGHRKDIYE
jgi:mRNA interferase RelE/StbE